MKPISVSEQMLYNTVRLEAPNGSSGTGFFFNFNIDNNIYPVLITNKHVVNYNQNETMKFLLHLKNGDEALDENFEVTFTTQWNFHSTQDICFCFVNPLFEEVKKLTGKYVYYTATNESLIYSEEGLKSLSCLESVVMVGYPSGLWDEIHNYPLFRTGFTSAHPAYDFNKKNIGVVDMACFPGSSGSPIYILNENGYSDKQGNTYLGAKRLIFLGILFAGPTTNIDGEIVVMDIPTKQQAFSRAKTMINLGYYIKAHELDEFKTTIKRIINANA